MIHRQFKGEQVIGGMLPLVFYPFEQLSQIIVGNGFSIRKTALGSILEVLDVDLMVFFYGGPVLFKLTFHALTKLRLSLCPGMF